MDGLCTFKFISITMWVWCGVAEVYSMSCLPLQFVYLFNSVWGCLVVQWVLGSVNNQCTKVAIVLSGVKHKLRYGVELRVWEGIADSGEDYGFERELHMWERITCGEKLQVGRNP